MMSNNNLGIPRKITEPNPTKKKRGGVFITIQKDFYYYLKLNT